MAKRKACSAVINKL